MKILICFGTRPEAIKMAPICRELGMQQIPFKICVTAQHRQMLDQVLEFFEIEPDYDLDIMKQNQNLNEIASAILEKVDEILLMEAPDIVLVQGDTTTAMVVALAAFHRGIAIGHVEAGLRTYNRFSPFPEEANRQIISRITTFHFSPTATAYANLVKENIEKDCIFNTGNTVVDALQWGLKKLKEISTISEIAQLESRLKLDGKLILVTGHRRENVGKGLEQVCEALLEIAKREDVEVLYPVHLNPKVSQAVRESLGQVKNIHLIPPVSYPAMLWIMSKCDLIISDSGGIQEEAPAFGKVVLVTRETTERTEGLETGFSVLVGTDKRKIIKETNAFLDGMGTTIVNCNNPYGDGNAAIKIVKAMVDKMNSF